jgi:hypothetical protein
LGEAGLLFLHKEGVIDLKKNQREAKEVRWAWRGQKQKRNREKRILRNT